ncbi:MAG TPA: histidine kinase N-terminal 7TM domain-containing protein, partial [Chthoniobacterales bacterium]|nr:histidine kinase N-terminal 7TM domain-containing protein [Chthoniobacterales bacterium]
MTSAVLAVVVLLGKQRSFARWSFAAGMLVLAIESLVNAVSFEAASLVATARWQAMAVFVKSFLPGVWLCFSLSYSRGDSREFLRRWRAVLVAAFLLPVVSAILLRGEFGSVVQQDDGTLWVQFSGAGKVINGLLLLGALLVLTNLEKTLRAAVGTMQWRIKFLVLGVAIIFGARLYTRC